jgi:hypothetical protein
VKENMSQGRPDVLSFLVVDLGRGLQLTVTAVVGAAGGPTEQDLIRTAEAVTVDPNPDLGWLGGHP